MLSVDEAIAAILSNAAPVGVETISLSQTTGRVAAGDIQARITQPPFDASAMDGYAVHFDDARKGAVLEVIGEAPAGTPFDGEIQSGEAVRIFTGGVVPPEADHIVIQEDVTREGDRITITEEQKKPRHIRKAGIDFREGDVLVQSGEIFHEIHGSILAAANIAEVSVYHKPAIALFSNGDELIEPGSTLRVGQIINSNHYALTSLMNGWGGSVSYLGCASDKAASIENFFSKASDADVIIPVGGASVGDYDYVKSAFRNLGGEILFEKVAVRPGKPTWFGKLKGACVIGLPGNPASAIVTAALFAQPLIKRMAGKEGAGKLRIQKARLTGKIDSNGARETYLRARFFSDNDGGRLVTPATNQDSSLLSPFTNANCLIRRKADAPACEVGDEVEIVPLR